MSSDQPSARRAANLFDLRRIIGGLFILYGLLLTVLGLFDSQEEIDKAAGVNINLWAGVGMLIFGLLMITWALTRPLGTELGASRNLQSRPRTPQRRAAAGPLTTASAPAGATTPGSSSASTAPPNPPPTMRAPAAPAAFSRSTVRSTSGTDAA